MFKEKHFFAYENHGFNNTSMMKTITLPAYAQMHSSKSSAVLAGAVEGIKFDDEKLTKKNALKLTIK